MGETFEKVSKPPAPGDALVAEIARHAKAGREVLGAPCVPLLEYTAGSAPGLIDPLRPAWHNGRPSRRRDVDIGRYAELDDLIQTLSFDRRERRKSYSKAQARRETIAYDADIRGALLERRLVKNRELRRDIEYGRGLLAVLGAWPWCCYGPNGALPRHRWWEDEFALIGWRHWTAG